MREGLISMLACPTDPNTSLLLADAVIPRAHHKRIDDARNHASKSKDVGEERTNSAAALVAGHGNAGANQAQADQAAIGATDTTRPGLHPQQRHDALLFLDHLVLLLEEEGVL